MGQIREDFILTDLFSATFSRFLQLGQSSENRLETLGRSNEELAEAASYATRQLDAMRGALAAQQSLYSSQQQKLEQQGRRVQELNQKYQNLINTEGAEAAVTLRAGEALNRAQLAESRILQQSIRTAEAISRQNEQIQQFTQRMNSARNATDQAATAQSECGQQISSSRNVMERLLTVVRRVAAAQREFRQRILSSGNAMERLLITAKRVATAAIGFTLAKRMLQLSDATVQTTARLNLMAREGENVAQIQESIYQSAQRTRTSYMATADVVSKLGLRAGDAFSGSGEIIQFAENLNKQFVIAGASQQEISSASLQLTQALGSGVLRGEELNAVFEAAPNIIQTIADYLGVSIGEIRGLASDGQITAEIVKNAMLSATDTINEQFESMPMTWGQAWTMIKNAGVRALESVSGKINDLLNNDTGQAIIEGIIGSMELMATVASIAIDVIASGAQFITENWDYILPVLVGIGAAFLATGIAGMVSGLGTAAAWLAATWPFLLLLAIAGAIALALSQLGVTAGQVGSVVGKAFGFIYAVGYNLVADLTNLFAVFAEFFANFMNDPVAAVGHLISGLLDTILGMVETVAGAIDALLGSDISGAVSGFRNNLIENTNKVFGEQEIELDRMEKLDVGATMEEWGEIGADLGSKLDDMNFSLDSITKSMSGFDASSIPSIGEIGDVGNVGKVKSIEDDIKLSDEDLKLYRDLAERRYMNQIELKTLAPQISVSIPETAAGNISAQDVADKLKMLLIEQMGAGTAISHG